MGGGSGSSVTAGGLLFRGEPDGNFVAVDALTGKVLWKFQTGFGADAPPIVYEVDGEQYVAIGGNSTQRSATGDAVWSFSLKGAVGPAWWPPTPPPTGLSLGLFWRIRAAVLSIWPGSRQGGHLEEPMPQGAHGDRGDR
jgi:outer membrane protein assembly factor BamB